MLFLISHPETTVELYLMKLSTNSGFVIGESSIHRKNSLVVIDSVSYQVIQDSFFTNIRSVSDSRV